MRGDRFQFTIFQFALQFALICAVFSLASLLGLASPVAAQEENQSRKYLTVGAVLQSDFEFAGDLNNYEEEGSGYYLGGGYSFNDTVSLELGYTDANDYTASNGEKSEVSMVELSGLTHMRFDSPISPYLRVGLYHAETAQHGGLEADENGFFYGVGVDYALSQGQSLRLDFSPASVEGDDLDRLMLGLVVDFQR